MDRRIVDGRVPSSYLDPFGHGVAEEIKEEPREIVTKSEPNPSKGSSKIRFTLPMEPTESVDKGREYPPIVTADGRVDTDIDHLMDNPEDDDYGELAVQDIPSQYPKPRVVRVIDGSLDDDIDNLMNHDGTMAHTLVEAPKNFNRGDLKEINSKKSEKKHNSPKHSDRSLNKMSQEQSDEDSFITGVEIVPFHERNNSSNKIPALEESDLQVNPVSEDTHDSKRHSTNDSNRHSTNDNNGDSGDIKKPLGVEVEAKQNKERESTLVAGDGEIQCLEDKDILKLDTLDNREGKSVASVEKAPDHESPFLLETDIKSDVANASQEAFEVLKVLAKDEPSEPQNSEKHEDEPRADSTINSHKGISSMNNTSEENTPNEESTKPLNSEIKIPENSQNLLQELKAKLPDLSGPPAQPTQDTITILKKALDSISNESSEAVNQDDSQRALITTALKVAGESMTAAARMADALTCLVRMSHSGPAAPELLSDSHTFYNVPSCNAKKFNTSLEAQKRPFTASDYQSVDPTECTTATRSRSFNSDKMKSCGACPAEGDSCSTCVELNKDTPNNTKKSREHRTKTERMDADECEDIYSKRSRRNLCKHRRGISCEGVSPSASDIHEKKYQRKCSLGRKNDQNEDRKGSKNYEDYYYECEIKRVDDSKHQWKRAHCRKGLECESKRKPRKNEMQSDMQDRPEGFILTDPPKEARSVDKKLPMKYYAEERKSRASQEYDDSLCNRQRCYKEKRPKSRSSKRVSGDINESHSPKYALQNDDRQSLHLHENQKECTRSSSFMPSPREVQTKDFGRTTPWDFPEYLSTERYFDQVMRSLKTCSPEIPKCDNSYQNYIRAKLVGSCVDPNARDSDFDSIEFNANARMSVSRLVHCGEKDDSQSEDDNPHPP